MNELQIGFTELLNKYLAGKAWLAARPPCKDLEDKFYQKVKRPLAELIDSVPELQKCDLRAVLRVCDKLSATKVSWKEKQIKT